MKDAACIAVFGMRGSGKTTRVFSLIQSHKRVVVFDVQREYAGRRDFQRADSLMEVLDLLKAGWRSGFRIAYVPRGDHPRMLHGLASLIWRAQEPYERRSNFKKKIMLVVEEMNLGYPAEKLKAPYYAMGMAVLQGRHRGIEIIGVSQRPANVSANFRGNVAETYVLQLSSGLDLKAVMEFYGRNHEQALKNLKPHEWLRFYDGRMQPGRNMKP